MAEMVEGGGSLAWRLLATLEGGSLLLATSALLAYSARKRVTMLRRTRRPIRSVLLTNTSNLLGKELKTRLESKGCVVHTISQNAHETTEPEGYNEVSGENRTSVASEAVLSVDALIVVGAFSPPKQTGLQGMAKLVSEDVYSNLKLLESLSRLVRHRGCLAWACAGASSNAGNTWEGAGDAFDAVLQANLHRVAELWRCEALWVGRGVNVEQTVDKLVDSLLAPNTSHPSRFSIRNAANKVAEYVGRWLKIVT